MSTEDQSIITRDSEVLGGVPVFTGTRVPVDTLLTHLKAGDSIEDFLEDFPSVSRELAESALDLASELLTTNY
jgi:uncharacterized protein (DUF433 family)